MGKLGNERFTSKRDDWETPESLFRPLNDEFGFTLDVAANKENTKCRKFISKEEDGLRVPWSGMSWLNPPFGRDLGKWVRKASSEAKNGCLVVCLLPARTNTKWWHEVVMPGEIRFVMGRPRFEGAKHGLPFPLAIVVFGDRDRVRCATVRPGG